MLIFTESGWKQIRPLQAVFVGAPEGVVLMQIDEPLPGCDTHAKASARYAEVLHRFLVIEDARFLDTEWQIAKSTASRGMVC